MVLKLIFRLYSMNAMDKRVLISTLFYFGSEEQAFIRGYHLYDAGLNVLKPH